MGSRTRCTVEGNITLNCHKKESSSTFFICLVVIFVFLPTLSFFFFYDDGLWLLLGKHFLQHPSWHTFWQPAQQKAFFRPMNILFFAFHQKLFGLNPLPYHISLLLFHLANTLLLFRLARKLRLSLTASFGFALSFALFSGHHQPALWISAYHDTAKTFFLLGSLLLYLKNPRTSSRTLFSLLAYSLALLSKEDVVVFPFILLLFKIQDRKKSWASLLPYVLLSVSYILLYLFLLLPSAKVHFGENFQGISINFNWLTFVHLFSASKATLLGFLGLSRHRLVSFGLHLLGYTYLYLSLGMILFLFAALLILFAFVYRSLQRKDLPLLLVGVLWFLIALSPAALAGRLGMPQAYFFAQFRYTYFPDIGLFLTFFFLWDKLFKVLEGKKKLSFVPIGYLLLLFSWHILSQEATFKFYGQFAQQTKFLLRIVEQIKPKQNEQIAFVGYNRRAVPIHGNHLNSYAKLFLSSAPKIQWHNTIDPSYKGKQVLFAPAGEVWLIQPHQRPQLLVPRDKL